MKAIIVAAVATLITLAAMDSKGDKQPIVLTQQQTQCFDIAQMQAKTIPGKDVYYTFAVECGSKEEARAFRTGEFTKAI